ncbi:hypothetical protein CK203_068962 [Vitis vinifera]|uniref:Uncharacterized protein n=1 Tax=Vitis vinifera TaxID=29760 RepID=A0A438F1A5_VITVI|nr:hypothetical protein CK203_068962 [Vitis vinifera]
MQGRQEATAEYAGKRITEKEEHKGQQSGIKWPMDTAAKCQMVYGYCSQVKAEWCKGMKAYLIKRRKDNRKRWNTKFYRTETRGPSQPYWEAAVGEMTGFLQQIWFRRPKVAEYDEMEMTLKGSSNHGQLQLPTNVRQEIEEYNSKGFQVHLDKSKFLPVSQGWPVGKLQKDFLWVAIEGGKGLAFAHVEDGVPCKE